MQKPVLSPDFTIEDTHKLREYTKKESEKKRAFEELELLRKKGTITNYNKELASYREEKYG